MTDAPTPDKRVFEHLPAVVRYAVPAYLLLLLLLAFLGVANQGLYREQARLIERREALDSELGAARRTASAVIGPIAIADWAKAQELVPVPEGGTAVMVAADTIDLPQLPTPSLEIRTAWR